MKKLSCTKNVNKVFTVTDLHRIGSSNNMHTFNQFLTSDPILCPLKTPENQRISVVFIGYEIGNMEK